MTFQTNYGLQTTPKYFPTFGCIVLKNANKTTPHIAAQKKNMFQITRRCAPFIRSRSFPGALPLAAILSPFQGFKLCKLNKWNSKQLQTTEKVLNLVS
jgi:hypothetical protein